MKEKTGLMLQTIAITEENEGLRTHRIPINDQLKLSRNRHSHQRHSVHLKNGFKAMLLFLCVFTDHIFFIYKK